MENQPSFTPRGHDFDGIEEPKTSNHKTRQAIVGLVIFVFFLVSVLFALWFEKRVNNQVVTPISLQETQTKQSEEAQTKQSKTEKKITPPLCQENDSCCQESNSIVKDNSYQIAAKDKDCEKGYIKNYLPCATSLAWCEPLDLQVSVRDIAELMEICHKIEYQNSRDLCYLQYAESKDNSLFCKAISDADLRDQCIRFFTAKEQKGPSLNTLGSEPGALRVNQAKPVTFTITQSDSVAIAEKIVIEEIDSEGKVTRELGELNDRGNDGDLSYGDYVYSGTFSLESSQEKTYRLRAKAEYKNQVNPVYSEIYNFYVTRFPVDIAANEDLAKVINPESGQEMVGTEVLVSFIKNTNPDRIEQIIKEVKGEIAGSFMGFNTFQVRFSNPENKYQVLKNFMTNLDSFEEVNYVEPNAIAGLDS